MVLQTNILDLVINKLKDSSIQIEVGEVASTVDAFTGNLDTVHITNTGTAEVINNIIIFKGILGNTQANTLNVNAMGVKLDSEIIDINKHTDIDKQNDIIIEYASRVTFFIE